MLTYITVGELGQCKHGLHTITEQKIIRVNTRYWSLVYPVPIQYLIHDLHCPSSPTEAIDDFSQKGKFVSLYPRYQFFRLIENTGQ